MAKESDGRAGAESALEKMMAERVMFEPIGVARRGRKEERIEAGVERTAAILVDFQLTLRRGQVWREMKQFGLL